MGSLVWCLGEKAVCLAFWNRIIQSAHNSSSRWFAVSSPHYWYFCIIVNMSRFSHLVSTMNVRCSYLPTFSSGCEGLSEKSDSAQRLLALFLLHFMWHMISRILNGKIWELPYLQLRVAAAPWTKKLMQCMFCTRRLIVFRSLNLVCSCCSGHVSCYSNSTDLEIGSKQLNWVKHGVSWLPSFLMFDLSLIYILEILMCCRLIT